MPVNVIAQFPVHPDRTEEFLAALHDALAATRGFDGCEAVDTYVDVDRPGLVILLESWPTKDHHRRYLQWRRESRTGEVLAPFLSGPITFHYLQARPEI